MGYILRMQAFEAGIQKFVFHRKIKEINDLSKIRVRIHQNAVFLHDESYIVIEDIIFRTVSKGVAVLDGFGGGVNMAGVLRVVFVDENGNEAFVG